MLEPSMTPAEVAQAIRARNEGLGGTRRIRNTEGSGEALPPPPPGWVEPPYDPEIAAALAGGSAVGGEHSEVKEVERGVPPASPPTADLGRLRGPRPAHSSSPVLEGISFPSRILLTNDGTYELTEGEVKAIQEVCLRAIKRNLRDYLKRLQGP